MAKPVKVHELNKDDEIWFRASEHNISYPAVVVDLIDDFESGNLDVLIGTQMVSKGLDFERVKLVGVMDADSLMGFPDFRAEERAYDMLMQVSGRSKRSAGAC